MKKIYNEKYQTKIGLLMSLITLFALAGYPWGESSHSGYSKSESPFLLVNQQVLNQREVLNSYTKNLGRVVTERNTRKSVKVNLMHSESNSDKIKGVDEQPIHIQDLKNETDENRATKLKPQSLQECNNCFPTNLQPYSPSPADCFTDLIEDEITRGDLNGRIPLILIHGINGNRKDNADQICLPNADYFKSFLQYFNYTAFTQKYKVYRFHYVSNKLDMPVLEIASSLRNRLDHMIETVPGFDRPFIILAHSMGGLIARAYMNQCYHYKGIAQGQKGGFRSRLITLATPHHGTPIANNAPRVPPIFSWEALLTGLDIFAWYKQAGCPVQCGLFHFLPNRSDLRFDNFNGMWNSRPEYIIPLFLETNSWLRTIPHTYDDKITAYYGYIGNNEVVSSVGNMGPINLLSTLSSLSSEDDRLSVISVILQRIWDTNFNTSIHINYVRNDGVVPLQSAAFDDQTSPAISKRVECPQHNHSEMKDGKEVNCATGHPLFRSLVDDLVISPPAQSLEISPVSWSFGAATVGGSLEKTFTLFNSGNTPIAVSSVSIGGNDPNNFTLTLSPGTPFDIPASQSRNVTIRFQPTSTGSKNASVTFLNNSDNTPTKTINLSGTGVQSGCNYSLPIRMGSFGSAGGTSNFTVTAGNGCTWTASSNANWITINSGNNGTGTQSVTYTVAANSGASVRTGIITVVGGTTTLTFAVNEDGTSSTCTYSLSENNKSFSSGGGSDLLIVTARSGCTWNASSDSNWISITSGSTGIGTQAIAYSVAANPFNSTRYGTIRVQTQSTTLIYTVSESGIASTCTYSLPDLERSYSSSGQEDTLLLTASSGCSWRASSSDGWVSILSSNNGTGTQIIRYFVGGNPTPNLRLAVLTIQGENINLRLTIRQAGQPVVFPDIHLPTSSFAMADALVGSTTYQSVLIQNLGSATLYIGAISLSSGSADFSVFSAPQSIEVGGTGSVTMKFTPSSLGPKNAVFSISSNDLDESSVGFTLSGNGVSQTFGGIDFVWTNKSTTPDTNRISSAVAVIGSNIYVLGGTFFRTNYKYDPTINSWMPIADSPSGVFNGGAAAINGKIYVVHNILGSDVVQIYDTGSGNWTTGTGMLNPRKGVAVAAVSGKLYALGGIVDSGSGDQGIADVEEYDPVSNTWTRKADMPTARGYSAAVAFNNLIYVIGGMTINGIPVNKVEVYNPATNTWASRENLPTARIQPAAVVLGGKIYVIGGTSPNGPSNIVEEHDPSLPGLSNTWFARNPIAVARTAAVAGVVNNKIYVIGGTNNSGAVTTVEEGSLNASPMMNVPVRVVSFGDVAVSRIGEKNLEIQNLGSANLTLNYTRISGSNEFTLFNAPSSLGPGESGTMKFRLITTSAGSKGATFQITSNDPHAPALNLSFSGTGVTVPSLLGGGWEIVNTVSLNGTSGAQFIGIGNDRAYIGRANSSVTPVNLTTSEVLADIPFSAFPTGQPGYIALAGNRAYVALTGLAPEGQLAVIDTDNNSILTYVGVGTNPWGVATGNNKIYVSNDTNFTNGTPSSVRILDAPTNSIISTASVGGGAAHVAVDPATKRAYVANRGNNCNPFTSCLLRSVSVIDGVTNSLIASPLLPNSPNGVTVSGTFAYICTGASVEVLDISANQIIASIPVEQFSQGIASNSDYVFVANRPLNLVNIISVFTNSVVATVSIHDPSGLAVDPTTNNVYIVSGSDRTLSVLRFVSPRFTVTCDRQSLAISQGGSATINCTVSPIDGFSNTVDLSIESLPTGSTTTFSKSSIRLSSNAPATTTLTVSIPSSTVSGTYSFKVIGISGNLTDFVNMSVTVPTCSAVNAISLSSASFPASGGNGNVNILSQTNCNWVATTSTPWITITSASGTGNGMVTYSIEPNTNAAPRSGTINIESQTFTVYQGIAFLDVPTNHPFYNEIGKLSARGVTLGCGSGNYCPDAVVTREQMAAFIMRALGEFNPPTPATQRFSDVPPSNLFYAFIDRMAELQITLGCGGGNYCPSSSVLREQMAAFMIRALHEPGYVPPTPGSQRFNDVPPSNPFYGHIEEMATRGITLGCSSNPPLYCPSNEVTRAQMAAFLVRAFNL